MSTLHRMGRALRIGFGLSLVAAFAFVNGCASGDVDDESVQSADPSLGEATDNLLARPNIPAGQYACTTEGGRRRGRLVVYDSGQCEIIYAPGGSTYYCMGSDYRTCPDCLTLGEGCAWI